MGADVGTGKDAVIVVGGVPTISWQRSHHEVDEQVLDEIGALGWEMAEADLPEC
jgi:hypothetical protein